MFDCTPSWGGGGGLPEGRDGQRLHVSVKSVPGEFFGDVVAHGILVGV
jgi:hypothetical protein